MNEWIYLSIEEEDKDKAAAATQQAFRDRSSVRKLSTTTSMQKDSMTRVGDRKTYFLSFLAAPVSLNPLAKGLLSIFSCVIWNNNMFVVAQYS